MREIGPPSLAERFVSDVLLDAADGDGTKSVIERAIAFAQTILRTDASTDLGQ